MTKSIKHIYIISVLLLLMIGVIGTVSAETKIWNGDADQFLANLTSGNITNNTIATISESTAYVDSNYTISASNITIQAETGAKVTFQGYTNNVGFKIKNGNNITLKGITFKNFNNFINIGGNGVSVLHLQNITNCNLIDCNFINNTVNASNILLEGVKNSIVANCTFNNLIGLTIEISEYCFSIKPPKFITSVNITLTNCIFINNTAGDSGGAIDLGASNSSIIDCYFYNNKANIPNSGASGTTGGGAIFIQGDNNEIRGCNFINNTATTYGGAIGTFPPVISNRIINCNFTNNTATTSGGAIYTSGFNTSIINCTFEQNNANIGSDIYINLSILEERGFISGNTTLFNNKFIKCESTGIVKANVYNNNTQNLSVIGGEGAIIYNEGNNASISSTVNVLILGNETETVANGTTTKLYAQITTGSFLNYIIGENLLNFTIGDKTINGTLNGTTYTADYPVNGNLGDKITVSGTSTVNANNITILNGVLNIKGNTTLNITTNDVSYGEDLKVTVNVNPNVATGNVTIYINDKKTNTTELKNGVANFNIKGLPVGDYNITAAYEGDDKYINTTNKTKSSVKKTGTELSIAINVNDTTAVIVLNLSDVNGNPLNSVVKVNVTYPNGNVNSTIVPVINGKGNLTLNSLPNGDYKVIANFNGNENYTGSSDSGDFNINSGEKTATNLTITTYVNGSTVVLSLNLTDINGNPISGNVTVNVTSSNGYKFNDVVFVEKGYKELVLYNLPEGSYNVTALFNATEDYESSYDNCSFEIAYSPSTYYLNSSNVVKYYRNGTQYVVKLTNQYGNPVANQTILVTLNCSRWSNLQYNITTNTSGIATLTINLIAGKYSIKATFLNATPEINNITVIEVNRVLTANDVVKYYCNSTHYMVTVTSQFGYVLPNEIVTVKVYSERWLKPVTYNIRTNESGIALLKINLIAGIYSISANVREATKYNNVAVLPTLTANNLVKKVSQAGSLTARLVDGQGNPVAGKTVSFLVKAKNYDVTTDVDGVVALPIHLHVGTWGFLISCDNAETRATVKVIR